ncbi:DUF1380 domain-containing protein [Salmonella enterica subsp. arizonae]|nr:DUF1380 domain-containing protein [Salmonella enterica subsp. arizonae]
MSRSSSFFGASAGGAGVTLPVVSIPHPAGHGTGEHTGDGISDSTVQALYAGLRTEIPTVSVPADLLARVTDIAGRALDTEDAQAWPLVCQEYPGVAAAQADIARLRQLALAA